jgi:hypothetical protein
MGRRAKPLAPADAAWDFLPDPDTITRRAKYTK